MKLSKSSQEIKIVNTEKQIYDFIVESNLIENILREPTQEEIDEFNRFMALDEITIEELKKFVKVYQPNALYRDRYGLDVRVGNHFPPAGGPDVDEKLKKLLAKDVDAHWLHIEYELIHPFTDGNGRSGRALWAWKHRNLCYGFLRGFYYRTLDSYSMDDFE